MIKKENYAAPTIEVVLLSPQGIICTSETWQMNGDNNGQTEEYGYDVF